MNSIRLWLLWGGVVLGSALVAAITAPAATRAHAAAQTELASLQATAAHAEELASLRLGLAHEATDEQEGTAGTLAERVAGALADAGLPGSALQGVSPESRISGGRGSRAGGGGEGTAQRRRATITMAATLPQLGRFLDAWRNREPRWTVSGIDLAPEARGRASPSAPAPPIPGGDLLVRAVLTIESIAYERGSTP